MSCPVRHPYYDRPCEVSGEHATELGLDLHETTYDGERLRWTCAARWTRPGIPLHQPGCAAIANWNTPCSCGEDIVA